MKNLSTQLSSMKMASTNSFSQQFVQIDTLLQQTKHYWQLLPFEHLSFPWADNSELVDFVNSLSSQELEALDADDLALRSALSRYLDYELDILAPLSLEQQPEVNVPPWLKAGIKGRKWQQIEKFSSLLNSDKLPVLEWCAGKGHLGRLIGFTQQRQVTSLEWQQSLCQHGAELSKKHNVEQQFYQSDVFSEDVTQYLMPKQHAIALHACGDLHSSLLQRASKKRVEHLSVVPCCYHLIQHQVYQPLSTLAQQSSLRLSIRDLNLSMQQTVVATTREKHHRRVEVAWRLAFDLLQRRLRQVESYLPLPSIKQSMLTGSFEVFCQWACDKKGLALDKDEVDFNTLEQAGWERRALNTKIELVTHGFRQLLERWLLLDRVLFLQQQGYEAKLSLFCPTEVTPRNTLISAKLLKPH
ncbi:methyltransferase [Psychrobium sp. 1_MG-2023]|uniref:methyltransferase n=1 Tax=Psychrobium sp. 1_MG-2023 TaxID=3062624 RepID=UPI000C3439EF|nr:methyltransferase [Psychrobium sp. 1_MG-2023]MDP2561028.1 methyltransferase [Psychrobium sp. 1_MG-2023]PKF58321.1 SAM-dependent methyltransferase [Alteromonadales bacterium alter-6D02]